MLALYALNATKNHNQDRHPHQPDPLAWWSADGDGTWFHGQLRGALKRPVLFLPNQVEVGRRWGADDDKGPLYTFEVADRQVRDTLFGRRPVWTIVYRDERNFQLNAYHEETQATTVYSIDIVEGRGPLTFEPSLRSGGPVLGAVIPLEWDGGLPPASRQAITPINDGAAIGGGGFAGSGKVPGGLSAIVLPNDPDALQLTVYGRVIGPPPAIVGTPGSPSESFVTDGPGLSCHLVTSDGRFEELENGPCMEALGTTFDAQGNPYQIYSTESRTAVPTAPPGGCLTPYDPGCHLYSLSGIFTHESGAIRVLAGTSGMLMVGTHNGTLAFDNIMEPFFHYGNVLTERDNVLRFVRPMPDGFVVGLHSPNQLGVQFVPEDGSPALGGHLATHMTGAYSVLLDQTGHRFFRTSPDGRVEEILFDRQGIHVVHLAEVELQAGEVLGGAVMWGEKLLVVTNRGFKGATTEDAGASVTVPQLGDVYAGLVTPTPGDPRRDNPLYGLEFHQESADMLVCWPPGFGPASLDPWTLGGETAGAIPQGDTCLLLLRNQATGAAFDRQNHEAMGPIPGAGKTILAYQPVRQTFLFPQCAPLSTGGCVALEGDYGPGLVRWQPNSVGLQLSLVGPSSTDSAGSMAADLAGNGLWIQEYHSQGAGCGLFRQDATGRHDYPEAGCATVLGPREGGGVWLQSASGQTSTLLPDGTLTAQEQPAPPQWLDPDIHLAALDVDVPRGASVTASNVSRGPAGEAFVLYRIDKRHVVEFVLVELSPDAAPKVHDLPVLGALPPDSEPALFVDRDFFVFQGGIRSKRAK